MAVEVVSPSDSAPMVRKKVRLYLDAETRMVWVVYPDARLIDIYRPDGTNITLKGDDTLEGGDVLPGFTVAAGDVFKRLRE